MEGDRCNGFHTHCLTFYVQYQGALPQRRVCVHLHTQKYGQTQNNANPLKLAEVASMQASFWAVKFLLERDGCAVRLHDVT